MVAVPTAKPVASPVLAPTSAILASEEVQATELEISTALPSAKSPVAVNCWELGALVPLAETIARVGETRMDCSAVVDTRSVVDTPTLPDVAVTVVVPAARPVARPLVSMVAMVVFPVLHVADGVVVLPSDFLPVAVNCTVLFNTTSGLAGLI